MIDKSGILIIDKPQGLTTNKVIQMIKKNTGIKKIGHAGTLDPLATGVVIVLVNTGTKFSDYLLNQEKEYLVTGKLYEATDSYDSDGEIIEVDNNHNVTKEQLLKVVEKFNGLNYDQTPPIYSAIKVNGKKLYEYAREDKEVEIKKRNITLKEVEFLNWNESNNEFSLRVKASKGTYIRSVIVDIAKELGTIAHVTMLRRTQSGPFRIEQAVDIDKITQNDIVSNYEITKLNRYNIYSMNDQELDDVMKGKKILIKNIKDDVLFMCYKEELVAIYHRENKDLFRSLKGGFKI